MYNKVPANMNFVEREKNIEKFWEDEQIFKKSIDSRKQGSTYTFYDGPPTANGKPHIGHVLTRVIKDMIPRYRTMKGYMVPRKAGWDTHGLPVELEVEKKLGLDGKEQIEEYGMEPFIQQCKESVWKYKGMWEDFSSTVGFWADMEHPYVTYDNNFIESEWWAVRHRMCMSRPLYGYPYSFRKSCCLSRISQLLFHGQQNSDSCQLYDTQYLPPVSDYCLLPHL